MSVSENSNPNFNSKKYYRRKGSRGKSFKSLKSIRQYQPDSRGYDVKYKSLASNNDKYKAHKTKAMKNKNYVNYKTINGFVSTDGSSWCQDPCNSPNSSNNTNEIICSLNKLNKRSTDTRNSPKGSLNKLDSDFERSSGHPSYFQSLKCATQKLDKECMTVSKRDLEDIWTAIQFQENTINKLISENNRLSQKLSEIETRFDKKLKDITRNVAGMNSNFENLYPIVKDITEKYNNVEGKKVKKKSRSPMRGSLTVQKPKKKRSMARNSKKYHHKQATSTKVSEVMPDSDCVPVINCNLQGFGLSDSESQSILETISKQSQKKRPVYFKSTLSSHSKIEKLSLLKRGTKSECASIHQTPIQKGKLVNRLHSPNNEIEQQLPQMNKLFSSAKAERHLKSKNLEMGESCKEVLNKQMLEEDKKNHRYSITKSVAVTIPDNIGCLRNTTSRNHNNSDFVLDNSKAEQRTVSKTRKSWFD